ncbi:hypothetical protein BDZ88DRAFT_435039, partial [Geranomyces variabilis]
TLRFEDPESSQTAGDVIKHVRNFLNSLDSAGPGPEPMFRGFELSVGERRIADKTDQNTLISYFDVFGATWFLRVSDPIPLMEKQMEAEMAMQREMAMSAGCGLAFVDVANKLGPERRDWSDKAPAWRQVAPGMSLEGKCINSSCKANGKMVIVNLFFGEYSPIFHAERSVCPMCKSYVDSKECGFRQTQYRFHGSKLGDKGKLQHESSPWTTVSPEDAYQLFRQSRVGTAQWVQLLFETKPLASVSEVIKCSGCLETLHTAPLGETRDFPCGHCFHAKCAAIWLRQGKECPVCKIPAAPENPLCKVTSAKSSGLPGSQAKLVIEVVVNW